MNERPSGLFDAIRYRSFDFRSIHSSASYLLHLNFLLITFVSFFFFLRKKRLIRETWKRKNEENAIVDSYRCTTILQKERICNRFCGKGNGCTTLISRSRARTRSFLSINRQLDDPRGGSLGRTSFDGSIALETMPVIKERKWTVFLAGKMDWSLAIKAYSCTRVSFHDEKIFTNVKSML